MNSGRLYVIGVGPGDPELIPLKALRILGEVKTLCVPKGREERGSIALSIIEKVVDLKEKEIIEIHFPMEKIYKGEPISPQLEAKWEAAAHTISEKLNNGNDIVFPTLGDPTLYSTFFYLYERLLSIIPELEINIIPGISSITAVAASAKIPISMANERVVILPAIYEGDVKEALERFDTVILMKVNRVFNKVIKALNELNMIDRAILVSKAGMEDEEVFFDVSKVPLEKLNYFSTMIIRKYQIKVK